VRVSGKEVAEGTRIPDNKQMPGGAKGGRKKQEHVIRIKERRQRSGKQRSKLGYEGGRHGEGESRGGGLEKERWINGNPVVVVQDKARGEGADPQKGGASGGVGHKESSSCHGLRTAPS